MKAFGRVVGSVALAVAGAAAGVFAQPATAQAATPALPTLVAYVRGGDVYVSRGTTETRLTTGAASARPRWSPDGRQIAFLRSGRLWVMRADGTGQRRLTTRPAAGPSWSPDSRSIAFASLSCTGGPGVYRISATTAGATPEVLFPRDCRGEALPAEQPVVAARSGSLNERLRTDDAVAWSPDGTRLAFRGGDCESVYDACLTIGTVATGGEKAVAAYGGGSLQTSGFAVVPSWRSDGAKLAWSPDGTRVAFRGGDCESVYDACLTIGTVATGGEKAVAAYGGGSLQTSGFAVVPSWRSDGAKLAWTAYQQGETTADDQPVHLVEYDTVTGAKRTVGGTLDREMAYLDATRGVATGQVAGGSWVVVVGLANGSHTPFHSGSQPSVQPVAR